MRMLIVFNRPHLRIDMALTDERILEVITEALPDGKGELSYDRIAALAKCHFNTVKNATRRLEGAGRLQMRGGRGRKPVTYTLVANNA